jgi:hypothetical protein
MRYFLAQEMAMAAESLPEIVVVQAQGRIDSAEPRQHATLSLERWRAFSLDQQILMIGNEMNRARKALRAANRQGLRLAYQRILQLTDLTIAAQTKPTLVRELLRFRDVVASLYIDESPAELAHTQAFRCLLRLTPVASRQIAPLGLVAASGT